MTFFPTQDLRPLVYPLTQLLLGTVRLVPTPRYLPLYLCCLVFTLFFAMQDLQPLMYPLAQAPPRTDLLVAPPIPSPSSPPPRFAAPY